MVTLKSTVLFLKHLKFDVSPDPNCGVVCGAEGSF